MVTVLPVPRVQADDSAYYSPAEIEDWLVSQLESTQIVLLEAPSVTLDASDNTMTMDVSGEARGIGVELNHVELEFTGTDTTVDIKGELSVLGKKPRFSCEAEIECKVGDKVPRVTSISDITFGGYAPGLSPSALDTIADTINNAVEASGLKLESLGGDLTAIDVVGDGDAKLEFKWSGGSMEWGVASIEQKLNDAADSLIDEANDYLKDGHDEGKWSLDVDTVGDQLTFEAEATALDITGRVKDVDISFTDTTAYFTDAVLSVAGGELTFSLSSKLGCSNYIPSAVANSLSVGNEYPGFEDWIEDVNVNAALRDMLGDAVTQIVEDTGLRCRISCFDHIGIVAGQLKIWYTAPLPPRVPTMNQWGIVAVITLFAGLLAWAVQRRRLE